MAEATIPVDLRNPGQVFACIGLMEAAAAFRGERTEGWFDQVNGVFHLLTNGIVDPVHATLRTLARAEVRGEVPAGQGLVDNSKHEIVEVAGISYYPGLKGDRLPARITGPAGETLIIANWADSGSGREIVKFWGGAGGFSGLGRLAGQLKPIQNLSDHDLKGICADPFEFSAEAKTGFRIDSRSGYNALDLGFSIDKHEGGYSLPKYPVVEVLGVIGLENARPVRNNSRLSYSYGVWGACLPLLFCRAALGLAVTGFEVAAYDVQLVEPNEYDRIIKNVIARERLLVPEVNDG